jgi:branched-chain amino acid transport system permease protein
VQQFLAFTFSGLTTAAIFAIVATGLVLTYTTTGVFNFAQGAMAMLGAFAYWQLHFAWGWPVPLALVVTLGVLAPLFGWGVSRVMRNLNGLSEAITLVASLGLLLGLVGAAQFIWDPVKRRPMTSFFEGSTIEVAGVIIPWDQVLAMGLAVAVAVGLWLLMRRTRTGVAMRAAVDDPALATLAGARPVRSAALAWGVGCSLAALSGILVAPTIQLNALQLSLIIVNAYGAAAIGRLRSIPMTFLGALILGLSRDYFIGYRTSLPEGLEPYFRTFATAIPAVVLLIATLTMPAARLKGRLTRAREAAHLPSLRGAWVLAVFCVAVSALVAPLLSDSAALNSGAIWGTAIVALSLVPLIGMAGQLSLAQLSFAGIGALAYAHLGLNSPLALLWAALWAAGVGLIVALPAIRLEGIYLALATGAVAVMLDQWVFGMPKLAFFGHEFHLFNGGSLPVARPSIGPLDLTEPRAYFVYAAVIFALLSLLVVSLRRSSFGQTLIAVKEAPAAAATIGINVTRAKLGVFALSAAIAGVGGAVLAGSQQSASPDGFSFFGGLPILLVMVVGGSALSGSAVLTGVFLAGGGVLALTPLGASSTSGTGAVVRSILIGGVAVALARNPNGIITSLRRFFSPIAEEPLVIAALVITVVGAWTLRYQGALADPAFGWIVTLAVIGAAGAARRLQDRKHPGRVTGAVPAAAEVALGAPPELLGLTVPFTGERVAALDDVIRAGGSTGVPAREGAGRV